MKLSRFILENLEPILKEWEAFASTLGPAADEMSHLALLDHAKPILQAIAADIDTDQSNEEQFDKSQGNGHSGEAASSAASTHGTLREINGFTLVQLTAEYRALRASVLRLWLPTIREFDAVKGHEILRFNEAIDQALAESAVTYSQQAARTRDTFLAMLGHDLRSPLTAMSMAGDFLTRPGVGNERTAEVGMRVKRSTASMVTMVNDLLEFTRSQLGGKMPIALQVANMGDICQVALDAARAAHPNCTFAFDTSGNQVDRFDTARLHQVFSNLLNNAVQYCDRASPVRVTVHGDVQAVTVCIANRGPLIPAASLESIFNPLVQLPISDEQRGRQTTSMGLGLFIAREITVAHGGTIQAASSAEQGTVFTVRLPRRVGANAPA